MGKLTYNVEDYIGKKFGHLTLVSSERFKDDQGRTVYKCLCDCGNTCYRSMDALLRGRTKYCDRFCPLQDNVKCPAKHVVGRDLDGNIVAYYFSFKLFFEGIGAYYSKAKDIIASGKPYNGIIYSYQGEDEQIDFPLTLAPCIKRRYGNKEVGQKVHYKEVLGKIYITPCKFRTDADIKVGSTLCNMCPNFISQNKQKQVVLCSLKQK